MRRWIYFGKKILRNHLSEESVTMREELAKTQ